MRLIESVSEYEMVAAYLQAEIASSTFAAGLEQLRRDLEVPLQVVTQPDTRDPVQNEQRARMLGYRGYGCNNGLFAGFPVGVSWTRAEMDLGDLRRVRYIRDRGWVKRSGDSRLAADAARRITAGEVGLPQDDKIRAIEAGLERGKRCPTLILVGSDISRPSEQLVVLEGHARLTAYLLRPDLVPTPLRVIIGYSAGIGGWAWF